MCGRVNIGNHQYAHYSRFKHNTRTGLVEGTWGIGDAYNARLENISRTWRELQNNRGIFVVDGFYEKNEYIHATNKTPLYLATLYNDRNDFVVVTRDSQHSIEFIHHRMPLLVPIDNPNQWINEGIPNLSDYELSIYGYEHQLH